MSVTNGTPPTAAEGCNRNAQINQLLTELRLLEDPDESATWRGTPESLQVITAGATSLTKWVTGLVGGGGGLVVVITTQIPQVRTAIGAGTELGAAALILGVSLLGVAVVLALAMVVRADVSGRATASAAQFDARAAVTTALLTSSVPPTASPVDAPAYEIQKNDGSWCSVERFIWMNGQLFAKVQNDYIPSQQWQQLVPS